MKDEDEKIKYKRILILFIFSGIDYNFLFGIWVGSEERLVGSGYLIGI